MLCSLSTTLTENDITEINRMEQELGTVLLAFSCHSLNPASLDDGKMQKLQHLEQKLGISLVAVDA